jgi:hypothetical protein
MDRFRFDARQLDNLDIQGLGSPIRNRPGLRRSTGNEGTALRQAINLSDNALLREAFAFGDNPPEITVVPASRIPVGLGSSGSTTSPSETTLGFGISASAGIVLGWVAGAGFYRTTRRELGVYYTYGSGFWTNAQASLSPTLTFVFGPPSDFGGISWGVGANLSIGTGFTLTIGAMLLFSTPPYRLIGFSFCLGGGLSVLPFDFTIQVSNTTTTPLLRGR